MRLRFVGYFVWLVNFFFTLLKKLHKIGKNVQENALRKYQFSQSSV